MNTKSESNLRCIATGAVHALSYGQAMHLGHFGGELTVLAGRIWLTRDGDLGDHCVESGRRIHLAVGENAVIEPWDAGSTVSVHWQPRRASFFDALVQFAKACAGAGRARISSDDLIAASGALK